MKGPFWRKVALLTLAVQIFAPSALAFSFNPNYIISDAEMTDVFSLDFNEIQRYLDRGYLGEYLTTDYQGRKAYAVDIIYRASQNYKLNPKFLIVLLQKEQSLIEDDDPTENQLAWATGYGVCDSCSKDDDSIARWEGFGKQVNSAAAQFRDGYLVDLAARGKTSAGYGPGISMEIDDTRVTPENDATAALYSYTPHLEGNENFARIWAEYFSQAYPDGSLLQAIGEDGVWLVQDGKVRPITSYAALISRFNAENIIAVDSTTITQYDTGRPISFPNYSLLRSPGGTVYLIVDDERRGFASPEALSSIGFNGDEIIDATWDELSAYNEGVPITIDTLFPKGRLLQDSTTGGVYFVQDGVKYPLKSRTLLEVNFNGWARYPTSPEELAGYQTGDPVLLSDGTLVKSTNGPAVYVISDGTRRAIASGEIFETMGWKWGNIIVTDEKTLDLHPLGEPIEGTTISDLEQATK